MALSDALKQELNELVKYVPALRKRKDNIKLGDIVGDIDLVIFASKAATLDADASTDVTVTGAKTDDLVLVSWTDGGTDGTEVVTSAVSAADTVTLGHTSRTTADGDVVVFVLRAVTSTGEGVS